MKIKTNVTGALEARANVQQFVEKLERGAMRAGLGKAARLVAAKVRSLAPVGETGLLKKSIRHKIKTYPRKQAVVAWVGPSNKVTGQIDRFGSGDIQTARPSKYAHLVEFGTAARGVWGKKGKRVTPGNPPQPFMRPAFESTKAPALDAYKNELRFAIPKVAASIQKRALK